MKFLKLVIWICILGWVLTFVACTDGNTDKQPSDTDETGSGSQAVSLFTLLSADNYDYESTVTWEEPVPPGTLPSLEMLPPVDQGLMGKELTVNLAAEQETVYFYYCKNTEKQTERLAIVIADGMMGEIKYPLLIVADVELGGTDALKTVLRERADLSIRIVAAANLSAIEGGVYIPNTVNNGSADATDPNGLIECFGKAGGTDAFAVIPRTESNAFHNLFDRFSLTEIMGVASLYAPEPIA